MLLIVDGDGNVLPAATIVWGPGVSVTHRGNNVWRVSNLLAASEVDDLATVIHSVTKERTVTRSVTKPVTSFVTRTNTQQPWVTRTATATRTQIQWVTVGSVIGGTVTQTIFIATRTRTGTQLNTQLFTVTQTRPVTVTATATRIVTKVVTVSAAAACPDDCSPCDDDNTVFATTTGISGTCAGFKKAQCFRGNQVRVPLVRANGTACEWSVTQALVLWRLYCSDNTWFVDVAAANACIRFTAAPLGNGCPPLASGAWTADAGFSTCNVSGASLALAWD